MNMKYQILISSPKDVPDERRALDEEIATWNYQNRETCNRSMLAVTWERAVSPKLGAAPQDMINPAVDECDAVIAVFHARAGTPTNIADSGTIEEIERALGLGKHVSVFFSNKQESLDGIDADQLAKVQRFKEKCRPLGILGTFTSTADFRYQISRLLISLGEQLLLQQSSSTQSLPVGEFVGMTYQVVAQNQAGFRYERYSPLIPNK